jgi:hypothetical protein
MQPAEEGFGGGDAPRQRFGTAGNVALFFHPFEIAVEVSRGDLSECYIVREELGKDMYVGEEGFDGVR